MKVVKLIPEHWFAAERAIALACLNVGRVRAKDAAFAATVNNINQGMHQSLDGALDSMACCSSSTTRVLRSHWLSGSY